MLRRAGRFSKIDLWIALAGLAVALSYLAIQGQVGRVLAASFG
jgi:hypothetical protein